MKRKKILALTLAAAMSLALFSGCSRPSASSGGMITPLPTTLAALVLRNPL